MRLTFRQGIARYQTDVYATPTFLKKSVPAGDFVDLIVSPDPTIIIFAHRNATYIVEESKTVPKAWGPFAAGITTTRYLYWDINLLDASLTRGFTIIPPIITGTAPPNPVTDTHWFDTTENLMKVWNGKKWVEKIRVFAATFSSSAVITPMPLGTQVGLVGDFEAGDLVLDAYDKPLRQSDGSFVTSATGLSIVNAASKKVKFESEIIAGMADEYIPKYSWVQVRKNRRLVLGRSDQWRSRVAGIVTEDLYQSEVGTIITDGLVRNEQWSFSNDVIGRPVFCTATGEVSLTPPGEGVSQICGYVYDVDSIQVEIKAPTILTDISSSVGVSPLPDNLPPIADFTASVMTGTLPLTVNFKSTSLHNPDTVEWDFTNDGTYDATGATATYVYTTAGTYTVHIRAKNAFGMDEEIKTGFITVNPPVVENQKTNLGITLEAPAQNDKSSPFTVTVKVTNVGNLSATQVRRLITIPDMGSTRPIFSELPAGTTSSRVSNNTTILTLPVTPLLVTGQLVTTTFKIMSMIVGDLKLYGAVVSPELDSTYGDNNTALTVKVK